MARLRPFPLLATPLLAALGCLEPEGPPPTRPGETAHAASPARGADLTADLAAIPLPGSTPAEVWTRTAPVSLVDERGAPLAVLPGHHTRLALLHTWGVRAEIRCDVCPTPTRGWVQARLLMPADHAASAEERADARLALALAAADLRRSVASGGPLGPFAVDPAERDAVLGVLDQGFVERDGRALAPASGTSFARAEGSVQLRLSDGSWVVEGFERPSRD